MMSTLPEYNSQPTRPTICIISFSPIAYDTRVLRQIEALAPEYNLIVIGYGPPPLRWHNAPGVKWFSVKPPRLHDKSLAIFLLLGLLDPFFYEQWYWLHSSPRQAYTFLHKLSADLIIANESFALPLANRLAAEWNAPLILDLHEYEPLMEDQWLKKMLFSPKNRYLLERYAKQVSATMTVAPALAQRYQEEFGFRPTVVFNVPYYDNPPPDHNVDSQMIRLVHVGTAIRGRQIELMIDTIRYCDQRYHLSFVLLPYYRDPRYIHHLQLYAQNVAPGRISFLEPTTPDQIVHRLASFDMGIYLLKPTSSHHSIALPNKLFQFLHAGLAVCIGPTPGMAAFVKEWQCGIVAPSFDPKIVAATLNQLDTKEIERMRQAARTAAVRFSAATEMEKVVNLCRQLLEQKSKIRGC